MIIIYYNNVLFLIFIITTIYIIIGHIWDSRYNYIRNIVYKRVVGSTCNR